MARRGKRGYPQEFRDEVVKAVLEGMRIDDAAKEFNVSRASISVWMNGGYRQIKRITTGKNGSLALQEAWDKIREGKELEAKLLAALR